LDAGKLPVRSAYSTNGWAVEVYGNNRNLTGALDDHGEIFLTAIAATHQLWDRDPAGAVPAAGTGLGRPRRRRGTTTEQAVKPGYRSSNAEIRQKSNTEARNW
jgi:hypothetical protein